MTPDSGVFHGETPPRWAMSVIFASHATSTASPSPDVSMVCSDALAFLGGLGVQSVDLVFGSPPYDGSRTYGLPPGPVGDAWVAWMVDIYKASLLACRGLVAFVVEGKTRQFSWSATPALLMAKLHQEGICLRKPPIYKRVGIPGSGGPDWLRNDYELIVCATNGGKLPWSDNTAMGKPPKYVPGGPPAYRVAGVDDARVVGAVYSPPEIANPGNVIERATGGGHMGHRLAHENEAPFPESLAEFFVRSFCPPGGVVVDPFLGSGTVAAAAIKAGRKFAGCDIRQTQVDLARRRLDGLQVEMF